MKSVFDRAENIVGKKENAGYYHFLHLPHCFQKVCSSESFKQKQHANNLTPYFHFRKKQRNVFSNAK